MRQNAMPQSRAICWNPRANANVYSQPHQSGMNSLDVNHVAAVEDSDAGSFIQLSHQTAQDRPRTGMKIHTADRVEAQVQNLQSQIIPFGVLYLPQISEHDQRFHKPEGRA